MKFGFELEAFCLDKVGNPVLVPNQLPFDECGWLVEARSQPNENILRAIYLLKAELAHVEKLASEAGVVLKYEPRMEIPRDLKVKAARQHGKGLISYKNLYGYETHRNSTKEATASLHVSVTNEQKWGYADKNGLQQYHVYQGFVDHAKLITGLDQAFKDEIKAAKRNPGFYEVKPDGRIEYRSLPNNVDLDKLTGVLSTLFPAGA